MNKGLKVDFMQLAKEFMLFRDDKFYVDETCFNFLNAMTAAFADNEFDEVINIYAHMCNHQYVKEHAPFAGSTPSWQLSTMMRFEAQIIYPLIAVAKNLPAIEK